MSAGKFYYLMLMESDGTDTTQEKVDRWKRAIEELKAATKVMNGVADFYAVTSPSEFMKFKNEIQRNRR